MKSWMLVLGLVACAWVSHAQTPVFNPHQKGRMYLFWGWNRAAYSNSDITLKGADYDFTIHDVVAHDRPTYPIAYDPYLKLGRITIPQTNFKVGYFIKDGMAISAGLDHMKYVMDQYQVVDMTGTITREGKYKGVYNGPQKMEDDLLTFEHTDGLNYINVEIEKYAALYKSRSGHFNLSVLFGGGAGALLPKTNVQLLDYERNDRFHLSGFGIDAKAGIEMLLFKHVMLRLEGKAGFIDMPDIILHTKGIPGRGKQYFFFGETDFVLGYAFNLATHPRQTKSH